jgi:hypothetical protein
MHAFWASFVVQILPRANRELVIVKLSGIIETWPGKTTRGLA